jgi:hypothetical protein
MNHRLSRVALWTIVMAAYFVESTVANEALPSKWLPAAAYAVPKETTKQGYPDKIEKPTDYPGGYPFVYDPATGKAHVYPIAVPHQGIISITPNESCGIACISTCATITGSSSSPTVRRRRNLRSWASRKDWTARSI